MTRVGAAEKAAIERLGVRVIDASDAGWGIINHDLFLSNAEVLKVIRRAIDTAAAGTFGFPSGTIAACYDRSEREPRERAARRAAGKFRLGRGWLLGEQVAACAT